MRGAQTIARLSDWAAQRYGDEEALVFGEERWTFRQLRDRVDEAARAAMAQGLRPGDAVAVWAPNSARWAVAALGAVAAGGVLVPVNTRYRAAEAADMLRRSRARLLFTEHDFLGTDYRALLAESGEQLPLLERTVALHTPDWDDFLAGAKRVTGEERLDRTAAVQPGDSADILFTSGTTGRPKGVPATHEQTLTVFDAWATAVTLQRGDRYLLVNPFFHTFGYKAGIVACLLRGATIVPEQVFDADTMLDRIQSERISVLTGAPTVFTSLIQHPGREAYDLSSMRMAGTGAANIPTELIYQIREFIGAKNIFTAYGLTESTGVVSVCEPHESPETLAGTSGTALAGTELRIDAPPGQPGEILTRGPHVMHGYLDDPEATEEAVDADGWLHTGDVGVLDERGFLRITDRLKDMLVVGGFNVYPAEVEQVLRDHPAVADAAVVGAPDERLGEIGVAYCVPSAGARIDPAELTAYTRERLANFKAPRAFHSLTTLPHNAAGKVDKNALRLQAKTG
ncbi:FadD3 family acyl-CoA ligase [Streptomyces cavernicola]|uniref:FadD3 family acyl-CoA ligase n=1 Tax=Streptomyces cavernicola TaxID=3043613 RepID=A0ABT6SKS3_9ACTN|nr:FadD3 family acyl-CoA ligase [Streptomyces sp. B-S-A6]MDI3408786.1 FadD3 family acyl-CoA ligase [Streptomyces sp. B-S-A6]